MQLSQNTSVGERPSNADQLLPFSGRIGAHLVIDAWCAESSVLTDSGAVASLAQLLAESCDASVLQLHTHRFEPTGGLTVVGILSASHVAIHTWPEYSYVTVDLFVCDPARIHVQTIERAVETTLTAVSSVASLIERPMVGGQQ